jgi:hypothetical protein
MAKVGRPRLYQGGRVKTTTEFPEELDRAIVRLAQQAGKSKTAYLEAVLLQVPEIAEQIEQQKVDRMIAQDRAIIL